MQFPMRINKYLAEKKYATRRGADELIKSGKVKINGKLAQLGDKVTETDAVVVDSAALKAKSSKLVYFAYNKPKGVLTNPAPETVKEKKFSIEDTGKFERGVFPVGRLDEMSHGLLIMTNDGRLTDRLLNPRYNHEREYAVKVNKPITQNFLTRMGKGVKIEDGITKKAQVTETGAQSFRITLTEGKKHQIRRMVTALGYEVTDLERVRILNIRLGELTSGEKRRLAGKELADFLKAVGL